jgi:hypothetical protein
MKYTDFLTTKRAADVPTGFDPSPAFYPKSAFNFQRDAISWGCRRGRAAFFEDCGLGKTLQQLTLADQIISRVGGPVLILAPIGVAWQTVREGDKFGIKVNLCGEQSDLNHGINITNYEKLHKFDLRKLKAVLLDESSILKSYSGKFRTILIEETASIPYRTAWTATPAPNDYEELGNHAEFLGVMSRTEMLSTFFVHDGGDTSQWRLKGHAEAEFWRWVCSWAISIRRPSDLGYDDGGFVLPELKLVEHVLPTTHCIDGFLIPLEAQSLEERRNARRSTINERAKMAADLALSNSDQWVLWCGLNDEAAELVRLTGFEEISGSTSDEERDRIARGFIAGSIRGVVTKPRIWGWGMNLQCCHNTAFVGLSDSYEEFYQAVRRFWRFGQTSAVNAHIITSQLEGNVLTNIKRKGEDARKMSEEMAKHMASISGANIRGATRQKEAYEPTKQMALPEWLKAA